MDRKTLKAINYGEFRWPRVTADTPLSEIKRIHWLIWDYAINRGEKPCTPYFNDCVLCRYASNKAITIALLKGSLGISNYSLESRCHFCPVKWPNDDSCGRSSSLYLRWFETRDPELAKKIRDLPFKEDI